MNIVKKINNVTYKVNNEFDALDRICTLFEKDILFDSIIIRTNITNENNKSHRFTFWLENNNKYNDNNNYGINYGIYDINTIYNIILDLLLDNKLMIITLDDDKNNTLYRIRIEY